MRKRKREKCSCKENLFEMKWIATRKNKGRFKRMPLIMEHRRICQVLEEIKGYREERIQVEDLKESILQEDLYASFGLPLKEASSLDKKREKGSIIPLSIRKDAKRKRNEAGSCHAEIIDIKKEKEKLLPKGQLFEKGDLLFPKGTVLTEEEIPLLKIAEIKNVKELKKKRIIMISTSTENIGIYKGLLESFPVQCKICHEKFSIDLLEEERQNTDLFIADDIKSRQGKVYSLYENQREEVMGLCMYKGKGVFHLPHTPDGFLSSLVWIVEQLFSEGRKARKLQKVLLGEDMKASLYKKQHSLMYIKCEQGHFVAYPLKGENLKDKKLLKKKKAVFSMENRREVFQRGEWIEVIWI